MMSTAFPNCFWLLPEIKEYHCATNPPVIVKFRMVRSLLSHQTPESSRNWGKAVYFYDVWTKEWGHLFFILFSGGWGDMSLFYYLCQINNLVFPYQTAGIAWTNHVVHKHHTASWWKFLPKIFQMNNYLWQLLIHIFKKSFTTVDIGPSQMVLIHGDYILFSFIVGRIIWVYFASQYCCSDHHLSQVLQETVIRAVDLSGFLRSLTSLRERKQAWCHHTG